MSYRKLGRTSSQRKAMLRDITTDLIINERIVTTEARAKEVRSTVEKMITLGKRGIFMHVVKQLLSFVMKLLVFVKKMSLSLLNQLYKSYLTI